MNEIQNYSSLDLILSKEKATELPKDQNATDLFFRSLM